LLEVWLMQPRIGYVCGPLTDLPKDQQDEVKAFYVQIGDLFGRLTDRRAFVPHEHYDPVRHAHFTPREVYEAECRQVCQCTSVLVIAAIAPSWGGGMEAMMAQHSEVPVILLWPNGTGLSRLLRGVPAIRETLRYDSPAQALALLEEALKRVLDLR
jgi:hypothetical protein